MYKTVTVWIEANGKSKLEFNYGVSGKDNWISINDGNLWGDLSIHCNLQGLTQLISGLNKLKTRMGEVSKVAQYK